MKEFIFSSLRKPAGFTLIELLVVIGILGILAATLIAAINPLAQVQKANDARRISDLAKIKLYLEEYYNDHGDKYPTAGSCSYGSNCYVFSADTENGPGGSDWIPALVPEYVSALPVDPKNNQGEPWNTGYYSYGYGNVSLDGQHYDLFTQLEYANNPQRCGLQDYMFAIGIDSPGYHWCTAFGGDYSNQIYAVDQ